METSFLKENTSDHQLESNQRISWRAIFAGVLIAIVTQIMLSLLGLGIGLSTIDAATEANPTKGLGTGSLIWYGISSIAAIFAGAWVTGRMAKFKTSADSVIHGLLTWGLVLLITFYLLTTAIANIIGGAGRLIGGVTKVAGQSIGAAAPEVGKGIAGAMKEQGIDLSDLKSEANRLLNKGSGENKSLSDNLIDRIFEKNKGEKLDRNDAVSAIMRQTGKSKSESEAIVDTLDKKFEETKVKFDQLKSEAEVKGRQAADDAAKGASKAAFATFIGLLLGAIAAGFGSKLGQNSNFKHNN